MLVSVILLYHTVSHCRITQCHIVRAQCHIAVPHSVILPYHTVSYCQSTQCHIAVSYSVILPYHTVSYCRITQCLYHTVSYCRITPCHVAVSHRIMLLEYTVSYCRFTQCHIVVLLSVILSYHCITDISLYRSLPFRRANERMIITLAVCDPVMNVHAMRLDQSDFRSHAWV